MTIPDGFEDVLVIRTTTSLSLLDRLKILFGCQIETTVHTALAAPVATKNLSSRMVLLRPGWLPAKARRGEEQMEPGVPRHNDTRSAE